MSVCVLLCQFVFCYVSLCSVMAVCVLLCPFVFCYVRLCSVRSVCVVMSTCILLSVCVVLCPFVFCYVRFVGNAEFILENCKENSVCVCVRAVCVCVCVCVCEIKYCHSMRRSANLLHILITSKLRISVAPRSLAVSLRQLVRCDCGFEFRRGHGCRSVVNVVWCQVEVPALGWSLVCRSPTEYGVSEWDREASIVRKPWPTRAVELRKKLLSSTAVHKGPTSNWALIIVRFSDNFRNIYKYKFSHGPIIFRTWIQIFPRSPSLYFCKCIRFFKH
jgi:hypothetical protein